MKRINIFKMLLLSISLIATSETFAQTPDQVYIPKLGTAITKNQIGDQYYTDYLAYNAFGELANGGFVYAYSQNISNTYSIKVNVVNVGGTQTATATINGSSGFGEGAIYPEVAVLKDGSFVVAYVDRASGTNTTVKLQKFTAAGVAIGSAITVSTTTGRQSYPKIIALDNGGLAVWVATDRLIIKQYDASLTAVGTGISIPASAASYYYKHNPFFKLKGGNYAAVSTDDNPSPFTNNMKIMIFDAATGNQLGTTKTLTDPNPTTHSTSAAPLQDGGLVVTWKGSGSTGIQFQRYDAAGTPIGSQVTVVTGTIFNPVAIAGTNGGFVILYEEINGSGADNFAGKLYDASGTLVATELVIANYDTPSNTKYVRGFLNGRGLPTGGYVFFAPSPLGLRTFQYDANLAFVQQTDVNTNSSSQTSGATQDKSQGFKYGNAFAVSWVAALTLSVNLQIQRFGATSCLTAPTLSGTTAANTCPTTSVNLSNLVTSTAPSGSTVRWFNNSTASGSPLSTPTAVNASGTYYAFYYNSTDNCYTPASAGIAVTINTCVTTCNAGNVAPVPR